MKTTGALLFAVALAGVVSRGFAQDVSTLMLVEPTTGSFLLGNTLFKARVAPESTAVASVEFFVDGKSACQARSRPFECSFDVGEKLASHTVRVVASLSDGQRLSAVIRTADRIVDEVSVEAVLVPVVVTDRRGRFVKGLRQDAFTVFENERRQPIVAFKAEDVPLDLVLALDVSASMGQFMPQLKAAARQFAETVDLLKRPNTAINLTVIAFNDRTYVVSKPEEPAAVRNSAIDALASRGKTSLYDAILKSVETLGGTTGRKAVIVFSDGKDSASLAGIAPVEQAIRASDATVYVITYNDRQAPDETARRLMSRFGEVSGGRALEIDNVGDLKAVLDTIVEDLTHQYLLAYNPTDTSRDGSYRRIAVKTTDNSHQVRARGGYRAPVK